MNIYYCTVLEHSNAQQVIKVGPSCVPSSILAQLLKESACNAGDPSSIPGLERSPGEGIGYPLQYS